MILVSYKLPGEQAADSAHRAAKEAIEGSDASGSCFRLRSTDGAEWICVGVASTEELAESLRVAYGLGEPYDIGAPMTEAIMARVARVGLTTPPDEDGHVRGDMRYADGARIRSDGEVDPL